MTITTKYAQKNHTVSALNVTAGDEVLFRLPYGGEVLLEGRTSDSTSSAKLFSSIIDTPDMDTVTDLVDTGVVYTATFQDGSPVQGQGWIGLQIIEGTWDLYIRVQEV